MAKKRLFNNFPTTDKRGHYFYYDDSSESIQQSNSLPIGLDKFNNSALYTSVQDSLINKLILKYGLGQFSESQIKINKLNVINNGVSKATANTRLDVWLFDEEQWEEHSGYPNNLPETLSENELYRALYKSTSGYLGKMGKSMTEALRNYTPDDGTTFPNADASPISARIFRYRPGDIDENKGMGMVLQNISVFENLAISDLDVLDIGSTQGEIYSPEYAFNSVGNLLFNVTDQFIYIVVRTAGNGRRSGSDKSRDKKYQIYKIPSFEFYDLNQLGKADVYPLNPIKTTNGGGDYKAAFTVDELELYVDTRITDVQDYDEDDTNPNTDFTWGDDTIPNYSFNEIVDIKVDVQEPLRMNLRNLNEEFRNQLPNREIIGHKFLNDANNSSFSTAIQRDFEPVAKVNILGNSEYDLSAYQEDEIARQICSAPNQVELGFYISEYQNGEYNLTQTDGYGINKFENYKFYVLDWNDVDNKFTNSEEYLNDIPENNIDMLEKQNQNLYKFADLSETLIHNYSTPGIKIIKAVLFSHLPYYEKSQIVRWKFIETRIYLDVPITKYPDFGELGGQDFTTIPWPYTTPIIGGISENSKYKISIQNTLGGGKLADNEIIDIRFLTEANENDELGKSIQKMDLEQVRYFTDGYLDMTQLLQIPIVINETEMQDIQVGESFSDDGPKYIAWNEYTAACRETKEMGTDLNNDGDNYSYLCASEYPDVPFVTTGGVDNAISATNCCYSKFDAPPINHQWVAETCHNNGIIPDSEYKAYECRLALFEEQEVVISSEFRPHTDTNYWDCRDWDIDRNYCFLEESSVGQIFIDDNLDLDLKRDCILELNLGNLDGKTINDTNGNPNKGIMIGDYKIKKRQKNVPMKRDSFIKLPKKGTSNGAL